MRVRGTVLLVEDDDGLRELLADVLQSAGRRVVSATSGERALVLLDQLKIDLLVCDENLGGVRGSELIAGALDRGLLRTRAVLISGAPVEALPSRTTFLQKPFDLLAFRAATALPDPDLLTAYDAEARIAGRLAERQQSLERYRDELQQQGLLVPGTESMRLFMALFARFLAESARQHRLRRRLERAA